MATCIADAKKLSLPGFFTRYEGYDRCVIFLTIQFNSKSIINRQFCINAKNKHYKFKFAATTFATVQQMALGIEKTKSKKDNLT